MSPPTHHGVHVDTLKERNTAGVGENLQDHLELLLQYTCKEPVSLYSSMSPLAKLGIGLRCLPVSHFCSLLLVPSLR